MNQSIRQDNAVAAAYEVRIALATCVTVLAFGAVICQRWAPETKHLRLGS
jgi:hypothetical protein